MVESLIGIGQPLGSYQLIRLLGAGGMGEVYLAEHRRFPRQVAIKILRPELCHNPEVVGRFFNEARAASIISHPGIVQILDIDIVGDRAFMVMELLDGESLGAYLRRTAPLDTDLSFALGLGAAIASAVGAAHGVGIVHRDLKPDNVQLHVVNPNDGLVTAKILDFGIAKLLPAGSPSVTSTGAIVGTPGYMSPEQCRGRAVVDHRSDVYSLGCILYEALSGKPVFAASGVGDWIVAHISTPPSPLVEQAPRVPAVVASLVERMLAKAPDQRPQSMVEVATTLQTLAADLEVSLTPLRPAQPVLPSLHGSLARPATVEPRDLRVTGRRAKPATLLLPSEARPGGPRAAGPPPAHPTSAYVPDSRTTTFASTEPAKGTELRRPRRFSVLVGRFARWLVRALSLLRRLPRRSARVVTPERAAVQRPAKPRIIVPASRALPRDRLATLVKEALPPALELQQELILEFLSGSFAAPTLVSPGVLRFGRVRLDAFQSYEFFCVFLAGSAADQVGTRTFYSYVDPVAQYLAQFDRDIPKVVVAITDSALLGAGAQLRIIQFRQDYGAVVVPIYLKELKLAKRAGTVGRVLHAKLLEHCSSNYFHALASTDVATAAGAGDLLSQLIVQIKGRAALLAVYGPPLSGKTSLINLAEESLQGAVIFNEVRCLERNSLDVAEFVRSFAPDTASLAPEIPIRSLLHRHLETIVREAQEDHCAAALVLEDADWLVDLLCDHGVDPVQRAQAREFWSALAELTRLKAATLIVTGLRVHLLKHRRFFDWDSPVAGLVEAHRVPSFAVVTLRDLLENKGSLMNVFYTPGSIDTIFQATGGQIYFVRRLCERIVDNARKKSDPMAAVRVTVDSVRAAMADLVADGTSFYKDFFQPFASLEQRVLSAIATGKTRDIAALAKRVAHLADGELVVALDSVMALGLVEGAGRGYAISIPVLGSWIQRNQPEKYRHPDRSYEAPVST